MMKNTLFKAALVVSVAVFAAPVAWCQQPAPQKARMIPVTVFDAGQPQASIYKLYDQADGVICYVLTPELATRRKTDGGWAYEGNSVGSISCVKAGPAAEAQAVGAEEVAPSALARPAKPAKAAAAKR